MLIFQIVLHSTYYMSAVIHYQKYKRGWKALPKAVSADDDNNRIKNLQTSLSS